ncbi:hypothetical protein [Undibacterium sp.]|uniref:hypothetical protein n=1 Tax=Undibacterium sp. TaxID=1914977 RepID=UPI0037521EDA
MPVSFEESIKFADAALYLAKAKGRNRAFGVQEIVDYSGNPQQIFDQLEQAGIDGTLVLKEFLGSNFD